MSADPNKRPIIIIKKRHAAHDDDHGGQWKIAYADFVTAMMAFFLVMWLLSSTTEAQKDGIAQFFNATSALNLPAGNGVLMGGTSMSVGGGAGQESLTDVSDGGASGDGQDGANANNVQAAQALAMAAAGQDGSLRDPIERQRFEAMKAEIERQLAAPDGSLREFAQNIQIEMTPEGLRLQIFDRDGTPMFAPGATEPTPRLNRILQVLGNVLATVPNAVVVAGHTDGQAFSRGAYGNWELSSDRANSTRRALEREGVRSSRMYRVEGKASVEPLMPEAPNDPRNRRIAVTVMRADVVAAARAALANRRDGQEPRR
jgi:chemotaxis protein MotB